MRMPTAIKLHKASKTLELEYGAYLARQPQLGVFFAALGGHTRPSFSPGVARLYASRLDNPCSCLPAPTGVCR